MQTLDKRYGPFTLSVVTDPRVIFKRYILVADGQDCETWITHPTLADCADALRRAARHNKKISEHTVKRLLTEYANMPAKRSRPVLVKRPKKRR
jgi:hypothetical protein